MTTRRSDLQDVHINRALRDTECSTEHRLNRSMVELQIRPPFSKQVVKKQSNRAPFKDRSRISLLQAALASDIDAECSCMIMGTPTSDEFNEEWACVSSSLYAVTKSIFSTPHRRHDDNDVAICDLLDQKNRPHNTSLGERCSSKAKKKKNASPI